MIDGIQELKISNYQSLKDVEIILGNITAITGMTDSGKSAFFRAVKALTENQSGNEYITQGEKRTVVQANDVKWIQSTQENGYEIGDKKWERCGRNVPDEVREHLNMGEFVFGKDVRAFLNFSGQLDSAFIVQGNPADNAKIIGAISNIHVVYNGLREAEKDAKNLKKRITVVQEKIDEYKEQLLTEEKEFIHIDKCYEQLKEIYRLAVDIDEELDAIGSIKIKYSELKISISKYTAINKKYKGINFKGYNSKIDEITHAKRVYSRYDEIIGKVRGIERRINVYKGISINKGIKCIADYEMLLKLKSQFSEAIVKFKRVEDRCNGFGMEVDEIKKKIDELGVCDVCGSEKQYWNI